MAAAALLAAAIGFAMTAYYGGRAECRLRRLVVPVRYLDFRSMYTTACSLMELWQVVIAAEVEVVDATAEVQALLDGVSPERLFDPAAWRELAGLVQFVPVDHVLPERSRHGSAPGWQIGVNRVRAAEPIWYTVPDAVASCLLGGPPVRVVRALRFVARGRRAALRPLRLRGEVPVDPASDDFFRRVIEERVRVERGGDLTDEEKARLGRFLKVLANCIAYGIYGEMNRVALPKGGAKQRGMLHGLEDKPVEIPLPVPERPGEYFFAPLAALISGAARLMLALLEAEVRAAGGSYVFADTDSMAIVASRRGGPVRFTDERGAAREVRALPWAEVERVRERFGRLNPYDREAVPGSILRLEDLNLRDGRPARLYAYAISAKRYALFRLDRRGEPNLLKWSEHGLGHLLSPSDPDSEDRQWIRGVWELLVRRALGLPERDPAWLDRPAIGRITVSSPELLRPFAALNRGRPYAEQVKPGNFLLTGHLVPFGWPSGVDPARFQLIAPWEPDPRKWLRMLWTDRYSGLRYPITTSGATGGPGIARVRTYRDLLEEYATHPEAKSAAPDGSRCGRRTVGELERLTVDVGGIVYVGKESNRLEEVEAGVLHDEPEYLSVYHDPRRDPWIREIVPALAAMPTKDLIRELGVGRSTVKRWKRGEDQPRDQSMLARIGDLVRISYASASGK